MIKLLNIFVKKCIKEEKLISPTEFALLDNLRFAFIWGEIFISGEEGGGVGGGGGWGGGGEGSPEDSPQFPAFSQKDFSENRLQVPGTEGEILTLCVGLIRTSVANWLIVRLHKS